ncbi:hypothetical protein HPB58_09605 [Priestia filamentosa]|uniref:hypothetical protein n=1 Tax=Priestia filamentosa TaxID=1402861 RepID=UPI001FB551E2|nr:hypothetical protein [Priestia filamentosa]MED3729557.1 hypothetical protein [Priestia filamentosa]UOE62408.1 hypothetical protein HPB58_09605 [Priestia filamentosa]
MEIKVRNIDLVAVKKIDEMAKEKGISQQEFLEYRLKSCLSFRKQMTRKYDLEKLINKNIQWKKINNVEI